MIINHEQGEQSRYTFCEKVKKITNVKEWDTIYTMHLSFACNSSFEKLIAISHPSALIINVKL